MGLLAGPPPSGLGAWSERQSGPGMAGHRSIQPHTQLPIAVAAPCQHRSLLRQGQTAQGRETMGFNVDTGAVNAEGRAIVCLNNFDLENRYLALNAYDLTLP